MDSTPLCVGQHNHLVPVSLVIWHASTKILQECLQNIGGGSCSCSYLLDNNPISNNHMRSSLSRPHILPKMFSPHGSSHYPRNQVLQEGH